MAAYRQYQNFIRFYKQRTGETDVDMHKVAEMAKEMGWELPKPPDPVDLLAKRFSRAARQEIRRDNVTGKPYRANHAYRIGSGPRQLTLWVDIDEVDRKKMKKSLVWRREQMVGDGLQLTLDADHWNRVHPDEEPIQVPMDFTDDIEWRKNAPDADDEAA